MSNHAGSEPYRQRLLAKEVAGCRRVLDLGCADMPNPYLNNPYVAGFDLQKKELPENYQAMFTGDAKDMSGILRKEPVFDGVVCGEMVEHLPDPNGFFRQVYDMLAPGGTFTLSTVNPNSIFERILTLNLSRKYFYAADHICLYPQRWMIRMLERAGFTEVTLRTGGLTLPFVLKNLWFPRPWAEHYIATCKKPQ